jgi:two-component system response regulator AtoC
VSRVLIVDDEPGLRQSLALLLGDAGYEVATESDGRRALQRAIAEPFDLILCDVRMPEMSGLEFLRGLREHGGAGLVIMMSAYGGEDAALEAMHEGAYDYVPKPFRPDEVVLALRKAEEREKLRRTVAGLQAQLDHGLDRRALVAQSAAMRAALDIVARVAEHSTTVLVTGESGTGKEVIAQAIHRVSPRSQAAFIGVNCAAIPENLLESELFGHVRGSFTGAATDKAGLFEQAHGGTLLLDEIGELPLGLQAKLLRALQEGEIRRVGDQRTRRIDVRVLAATARDLAAEVKAGRFREDLFYRVHVVTIHLPPLRERREDVAPLAQLFAARLGARFASPLTISAAALAWLESQPWPGNVRELENAVERAAVLSGKTTLEPDDFKPTHRPGLAAPPAAPRSADQTLDAAVQGAERDAIRGALEACGGNRRDAARRLGISVRSLFYKIQRLGLE